ncbi:MAG: eukaryotic-like serine/threonine-protein kinase [Solirubrobacteraceae bacterium]|nr:eukaryotic-like serine/threonine-protein kinase [Solirubrobacteraceae bacterium]
MSTTPKAESVSHAHQPAPAAGAGEIVLARYQLRRRLGAGGMGVVYLAWDERLEREVAVKRIAAQHDPEGRGEREALAAARLSHPGIVALYESGRDDDAVYLVSEIVRGHTLAELLRDGELSDRDAVRIGAALCGALEHAHARGVIHRDVKPSNILCPDDPEVAGSVAKLADFGIARMADHDVLTRTGDIMGTLAYMAPEQARGERIDGAADVYALGVVLYEALAGANPIRAGNPAATARRVGMRLPALQRARRDLPGGLCRAIDAAVQPEPEARAGLVTLRAALSDAIERVADQRGPIAFGPPDVRAEPRHAPTALDRRRDQPARDRWDAAEAELTRDPLRPAEPAARRREPAPQPLGPPDPAGLRREHAPEVLGPQPESGRRELVPEPFGPWQHERRRRELASEPLPPQSERGRARRRGRRARHAEEPQRRPRTRLVARIVAGGSAAAIGGAALAWLGPEPPLQPAAGATVAAAAVLLLPRLGWLLMAGTLVVWLAAAAPGIALIVAAAAAPVALVLPLSGTWWSLPALGPLLGVAGLAGAWPALAGQARRWPVRAGLGALGGWWLALAEALTSRRLVSGPAHDVAARATWEGSAVDAARDALWPLLTGGALALAVLWAIAALLLPVLVRGRSAALDIVGATAWAAMLAAATQALAQALVLDPPRGLVAGAVAAAVVAVGARALRGRA